MRVLRRFPTHCILQLDHPPLAGIREGIASAATAFAIDRSLDEGLIVALDPGVSVLSAARCRLRVIF
ncbi:MAG: hypothetical protein NTV93_10910 [Verrucomicrobia bacterium]|nr:hypothetical protein [Verrucomicrobiota bacterium]